MDLIDLWSGATPYRTSPYGVGSRSMTSTRIRAGGFGDGVARMLREQDVSTPVRNFGLPREFLPHGERGQILDLCGLTPQHLAREITAAVARRTPALAHEQGA